MKDRFMDRYRINGNKSSSLATCSFQYFAIIHSESNVDQNPFALTPIAGGFPYSHHRLVFLELCFCKFKANGICIHSGTSAKKFVSRKEARVIYYIQK